MKVAILGGGPIGLYAAIKCKKLGFDYHIFEATDKLGGQLINLYPKKEIVNIPGIKSIIAEDYINTLVGQIDLSKVTFNFTAKETLSFLNDYNYVIVAIGIGSYEPRRLGIVGDDAPNILYSLNDYNFLANKKVVVFGGGDSALDWAAQLSDIAEVSLVHRRDEFRGNSETIKDKSVKVFLSYVPDSFSNNNKINIKSVKDNSILSLDYDYILVNYGMQYQKLHFENKDRVFFVGDYLEQTKTIAFGLESVDKVFKEIK